MNLIDETVDILSSENPSLTDALIKTKVLLHRLGEKNLVAWVNHELNGYGDSSELPEYRVVGSIVKADIMNAAYSANGIDVPIYHLENDIRDSLESSEFRQGISAIEDLAKNSGDFVQRPLPHACYGVLSKKLASNYQVQSAWCQIPKYSLIQIITQVRSRLLDFLLELSEKIPSNTKDSNLKQLSKEVGTESLFNNAVFGDGNTIIVGNNNEQKVNSTIIKNDLESLISFLREKSVTEEDINSLSMSISQDESLIDESNKELGPNTKKWMKGMLSKSVDGTWSVGTGVAGSLLAGALNNFYGWF